MPSCEHCQAILLDYLYAVLEESELREVREHLTMCPGCQAALAATQAEQKLLARAARAIDNVPEFTLPTLRSAEVSSNAPTVPLMTPVTPKRSSWRRPWIAWSTAAAVLLALGASVIGYRQELHARQHALADAQLKLKTVDAQLFAFPTTCEAEMAATLKTVRDQTGPYLHVIGPTSLQPHGKAPIHITTRNLEGDALASTIRLKLVEPETGNVLFLTRLDSDGQARGEIDCSHAKPSTTLNLIVEADTAHGTARLQETVRVPAPSYVTRLDTNKSAYLPKDVVFFRALVLDRYSLTPPSQPIAMRAELKNPAGRTAVFVDLHTGDGGILAGELPITEDFAAGSYKLHVMALNAPQVQSVAQSLEVVREMPGIRLNQSRYAKGDTIIADVTLPPGFASAPRAKATLGNGKPVDVTLQAQPLAAGAPAVGGIGGGGVGNASKAKGAAQKEQGQVFRFQMVIPDNLAASGGGLPLLLEFKDGLRRNAVVPLEPTEFTIDFFPEGGDLIEGVKNRVYYRVRSKTGEPVTGDGRVILLTGKNDIVDTHYKLGMGYLDFTPDSKEMYTVRITTPMKLAEVLNPFAKPGIRKDGVVLHVPRAVGKEGDPIRVVLRQTAPSRKLLLLAHCRGQIVEERAVELKPGSTSMTLQPATNAYGMIRVTAYEIVGNQLKPLAERLVYRAPAERLDLGLTLSARQLQPGLRNLKASIHATDEKGQPTAAWVLASIVDERLQPRPPSLAAHFLILNEIRTGADIDNAQLVLNDSAESTHMLERFLGTHGWRHFVPAQEPPLVALTKADGKQPSLLFSRENAPLIDIQAKYQAGRIAALRPVHEIALQKENELKTERSNLATAVLVAQHGVFEFEHNGQVAVRLALGVATLLLLLASLVLMAIGLYRLVRGHKIATPAFGSAFAGLAACLAFLLIGTVLGPPDIRSPADPQVALASNVNKLLEKFLAPPPMPKFVPDGPNAEAFLVEMRGKDAERELQKVAKADASATAFGAAMMRAAPIADQAMDGIAKYERNDAAALAALPANELRNFDRFERARRAATIPPQLALRGGAGPETMKAVPAPPQAIQIAPAAGAPGLGAKKQELEGAAARVEYFHEYVPNMPADTLLWHPTLRLEQGNAEVHFDIASGQATYRVLLLGHGPSGRFGFFETRLDVPAVAGR